ncbi:MAG: ATP-binding protein [Spirochaetes bacterium]|nr:ATP-binding protein [Spirochaetota bacterium]
MPFDRIVLFKDIFSIPFFSELKQLHESLINDRKKALLSISKIAEILCSETSLTVINLLTKSENAYSLLCEKGEDIPVEIRLVAENDIKLILSLLKNNPINSEPADKEITLHPLFNLRFPKVEADEKEILDHLEKIWRNRGCGIFSESHFFKWNGTEVLPIYSFDKITFADLAGYDDYKNTIIENTGILLSGNPANNILLAGSRGCGKSSMIKAVANHFAKDGLKLIEVSKKNILGIEKLFNKLSDRGLKFILFIDDISFDENEHSFTEFKSVLEGCASEKPANTAIYATSNRRHMVSEKALTGTYDIFDQDTDNEKISLSDRFGITLLFLPPDQNEFLAIAERIASKHGIPFDDEMKRSAVQWALEQKGRSGRSANQFITYIKGKIKLTSEDKK